MNISEEGYALLKQLEGLCLRAYQCSGDVWTIGYGHTLGVRPGDEITANQAAALLRQDASQAACAVKELVTVPLNQHQFDALVSFVFNIGSGRFRSSTLLRKLNGGDFTGAADELLRWDHAGGQRLPGLERRRTAERALFLLPV
ncbi:lysozyme [Salmonella enterica subsp. enterica]|nr:lysozyme [Salmonella enterica subsp. enterica]EDT7315836.1 lysozyme [Salmonella enterica subsp. enterica]